MKYEITARRLRQALSDSGMSARELSERAGILESSFSHYVNGSHKPSNINAGKLADVLNVNPLWLMGFDVAREIMNTNESDSMNISVSIEEKNLIDGFRKIDERGRDLILNIIQMETARVENEKAACSGENIAALKKG